MKWSLVLLAAVTVLLECGRHESSAAKIANNDVIQQRSDHRSVGHRCHSHCSSGCERRGPGRCDSSCFPPGEYRLRMTDFKCVPRHKRCGPYCRRCKTKRKCLQCHTDFRLVKDFKRGNRYVCKRRNHVRQDLTAHKKVRGPSKPDVGAVTPPPPVDSITSPESSGDMAPRPPDFLDDACYSQPCQEGKWCEDHGNGTYACLCGDGVTGDNCELACPDHCRRCQNESTCTECYNGYAGEQSYFVNADEGTCSPCAANCWECELGRCLFCEKGFTQDTNEWNCAACPQNCSYCTDANICLQCHNAYFLTVDSVCIACPDHCVDCQNETVCTTCSGGLTGEQNYYVNTDEGTCSPCADNCLYCESGRCQYCDNGFTQDTDGWNCAACPADCTYCKTDTLCAQCHDRYYLDDNDVCVACAENCSYCESGRCINCDFGFTQDTDGWNCAACPVENCGFCYAAPGTVTGSPCQLCVDGYSPDADGTCPTGEAMRNGTAVADKG